MPPSNDWELAVKPRGGLWTSTYDSAHGSGWVQWCLGEQWDVPRGGWRSWLLDPERDVRVLRIDSAGDLTRALQHYARAGIAWMRGLVLDYERLAADFDAVHLTERGQWATRLSRPHNLYGWDSESVLWLRWRVHAVSDLGVRDWPERR